MTLQKVWTITLRSWNELPTASETLKNSENVYFYASANRQILISENIVLWNFIIRTPTFDEEPHLTKIRTFLLASRVCKERSDGIAFCSTFPIYFWQNASPIRLFDVAKKTSLSLVFFVVPLNQPQLNIYSSAFTTIVNYLKSNPLKKYLNCFLVLTF